MSKLISFLTSTKKFSLSSKLTLDNKLVLFNSSNFLIRSSLAVLSFSRCPSYSKNSLSSDLIVLLSLLTATVDVVWVGIVLAVAVVVKLSKTPKNKSVIPNSLQVALHSAKSASNCCNFGLTPRILFNLVWRSSISAKSCASKVMMFNVIFLPFKFSLIF